MNVGFRRAASTSARELTHGTRRGMRAVMRVVGLLLVVTAAHAEPPLPPGLEPAAHRNARVSIGVDEAAVDGPMPVTAQHAMVGLRVGARDWIGGSFGWLQDFSEEPDAQDVSFWEASAFAGRWVCTRSIVCFGATAGAGYQHGYWVWVDDLPIVMGQPRVFRHPSNNVFAEARGTLRLDFGHVWIDLALGVRAHRLKDGDHAMSGGSVFSLALQVAI